MDDTDSGSDEFDVDAAMEAQQLMIKNEPANCATGVREPLVAVSPCVAHLERDVVSNVSVVKMEGHIISVMIAPIQKYDYSL